MRDRKTMILGATTNANRYAYLAANRLPGHGHTVINVGIKTGDVAGVPIERPETIHTDIDTVTLHLGQQSQRTLFRYMLDTNPWRIIINPGTENEELHQLAMEQGIIPEYACTPVLLSSGQY